MAHLRLTVAVAFSLIFATAQASDFHWNYEGHAGPEHWGELTREWATCSTGIEQSPINLDEAIHGDVEPVQLHWSSDASWMLQNNGHTVQLSPMKGEDAGYLEIGGERFELLQFHFHTPSEHAIHDKRAPMELHFVHKAHDGTLAVLGVMMNGGGGKGLFDEIVTLAPADKSLAEFGKVDPYKLVPDTKGRFYRYQGSLTTPPCSQIVLWTVLEQPIQVSDDAIRLFQSIFPMNARPLQPLNRRYVLTPR